ncbi:hypothetical protein [Polycladidibacter stylochi]|uniref:hypothetical protein n=1 Tax=Polycladidibacter stylochi TaxID=1807766 RepID=UPI00082E9E52|nr:hypothetical protein [Pseudovibrio stylochi]
MSWKDNIQLQDLEPDQRLEFTCKTCGHVFFRPVAEYLTKEEQRYLYLSEVEERQVCVQRGCGGTVRLAVSHKSKMSAFVGGLA